MEYMVNQFSFLNTSVFMLLSMLKRDVVPERHAAE